MSNSKGRASESSAWDPGTKFAVEAPMGILLDSLTFRYSFVAGQQSHLQASGGLFFPQYMAPQGTFIDCHGKQVKVQLVGEHEGTLRRYPCLSLCEAPMK